MGEAQTQSTDLNQKEGRFSFSFSLFFSFLSHVLLFCEVQLVRMEESGSELCSPRELNRKKTSCGCIEVHVKSFLDSGPLVPCLTRLSSWSRKWCSRAAGHTQRGWLCFPSAPWTKGLYGYGGGRALSSGGLPVLPWVCGQQPCQALEFECRSHTIRSFLLKKAML